VYLLDTNVISELRRVRPHGAVVAWLKQRSDHELFIASVSIGELQTGVELTRRQDPAKADEIERWIDQVVTSFQVIPMDAAVFREWAKLMAGRPAQVLEDAMIAATARTHRLKVVTRNTKDFKAFDVLVVNPFLASA
jgi:predicted nucleic acid-binding protein